MPIEEVSFDRSGNGSLVEIYNNQIEEFNKLSYEEQLKILYEHDSRSLSVEIQGTRADQNS